MRACQPSADGLVERGGVKIHYEVYGEGGPTILLLPTWTLIHKRFWKLQVPYLSRHYRVVCYDGPGNGRSDRPLTTGPYEHAGTGRVRGGGPGCHRHRTGGRGRGSPVLPPGRSSWPPSTRRDVSGLIVIDPALHPRPVAPRRWTIRRPTSNRPACRSAAGPSRALGEVHAAVLAGPLRGLLVVLLRTVLLRTALHQADRRLRRLRPGYRWCRPGRRQQKAASCHAAGRGLVRADQLSAAGDPWHRRPRPTGAEQRDSRRTDGGLARPARGFRAHPAGP